jgi:WD40 repeat protein
LIAAVAPGGQLAAFASRRGEVMLWDAETGQARFFARPGTNLIRLLVFSLDGRHLAAAEEFKAPSEMAGKYHDPRRTVRVWDVAARKETHVLSTDGEFLKSLTFSADAKALMGGSLRGSVLWRLDGQSEAAIFPGHAGEVRGLTLLPDGQTLISAGEAIRFWDVRTRRETDKLNPRAGTFSSLALSPDARRFAAGASDGRITIWDVASHQEVATLEGHQESVTQLAFTPDGDHIVSASKDQLRVWRASSPAETESPMKPNQR